MAWTAPMTAVAGNIFKASEFNTHIRDNLNETGPSFGASDTGFFVVSGTNSISSTLPQSAFTSTSPSDQSTTSTTYTDLATVGPQIVDADVQQFAVISLGCASVHNTSGATNTCRMSVDITNTETPAYSRAANDDISVANSSNIRYQYGATFVVTLVPGVYTFTAKYRVSTGTGNFNNRSLNVFSF